MGKWKVMGLQLRLFLVHLAVGWTLQAPAAHGLAQHAASDPADAHASVPLFCPCFNREMISFTFLMHYRDASTTVGAQLRAGVRQAARDRGLRVKEYIPVDFFRADEVISFLGSEIQAGTAGIITTLSTNLLLPSLAAANEAAIPIYLVGGPDPDLYRSLQMREPSTGPIRASIRHVGVDMARAANTLIARLMSLGISHLECITTEAGDASWHGQCGRLVDAFVSAGRTAQLQLRAGLAYDLADYALDMAARLATVPDRQVAVVVADSTLYRTLRTSLSFTTKADVTMVVYETAPDILADVRSGRNVVALDFAYYAQGYLALSLAAAERHTGQMVTSDIATMLTIYGANATGSQVTDAVMRREVCRAARYPVCGDPGVATVTHEGCPCFNRSEVAYKVVGLLPSRVPFAYNLWQGMSDAQRDLPGSTFAWDVLDEVDFGAVIADYAGVAGGTTWRGAISLDPEFDTIPPIVDAMRVVPAAGKPLYLTTIHCAGPDPSALESLFAFFGGAWSFVGVNAFTAGRADARAAVQAGLHHLVISNVLPFFDWTWAYVRGMLAGFLGAEFVFPPGLWEGDYVGKSSEGNRTGVYQLFVAPETNRTAQVINGISTVDYLDSLQRYVSTALPAPDVVILNVFDEFMTPTILAMLDEVARAQPGRAPVQLVTQKCFHSEMLALLERGEVQGEELLLGCMDEQIYLATYVSALLAALEQHTGERVVGEVSTPRLIRANNLPPNLATRAACELAGSTEGYAKGQWGQFYPVCDVRQGCVQGGAAAPEGTLVCSGHGSCAFPTAPSGNETTRGGAGACACEKGYEGEFCERKTKDGASWGSNHRLASYLLIAMGVVTGLGIIVGVALPVYCIYFRKGWADGSSAVQEFLRKRRPPQKGDVITAVITDIEGSTELWEWNPDVMKRAVAIHHMVIRTLLPKYHGYESDTAGDSFSLVFHSPLDAFNWAMDVQRSLLYPANILAAAAAEKKPGRKSGDIKLEQFDWPQELLSFGSGREEKRGPQGVLIYRGLRVRMGIHNGVADDCTSHASGRQHYHGDVMEVTKAITDVAVSGGQVLLSMLAWQSLGQPPPSVVCQHLGLHEVCDKLTPLHLMQALPDELALRLPYRPLKSTQRSPSFFDAPCSGCYISGVPPTDPVVIAFIYVGGAKALRRHASYQPSIHLLTGLVQRMLPLYGGYECEEKDGNFLLAFGSPVNAAGMAEALQRKAMELPWPGKLLELEPAAEIIKPAAEGEEAAKGPDMVVFRGLRLQIGLCMGVPAECSPHRATGRAAYYGPIVNRAARIAATAAAGQTLCNHVLYETIRLTPHGDLVFKEMGKFDLKGVREPMHLYQISSAALSARLFPRVLKLSQLTAAPTFQSASPESDGIESLSSTPRTLRSMSMALESLETMQLLSSREGSPSTYFKLPPGMVPAQSAPGFPYVGRVHMGFTQAKLAEQVQADYAEYSHEGLLQVIARLKAEMQVMRGKLM